MDFSIVTAVYNTAEYIDECIESVITQTVGFNRIKLILINDASTDDSLSVCKKWQERYPNNIVVLNQERNQGVSAARNRGLQYIEGKYVSFLDSDDKFTPNVCEEVEQFFQLHTKGVDIVALPIIFFDGKTGPHPLNDKFEGGTRIIDLDKEWYYTQNFISSTFVRTEVLNKYSFDTRMPLSEDLKFVQQIILPTHHLGVINNTEYLYRRRSGESQSAIQTSASKKIWYCLTLKNGLLALFDEAKKNESSVPKYLQFLAMYEIQWRLKMKGVECTDMSSSEIDEYYKLIHLLLTDIDKDVINIQKYISVDTKTLAKLMKKGWPIGLLFLLRKTKLIKFFRFL